MAEDFDKCFYLVFFCVYIGLMTFLNIANICCFVHCIIHHHMHDIIGPLFMWGTPGFISCTYSFLSLNIHFRKLGIFFSLLLLKTLSYFSHKNGCQPAFAVRSAICLEGRYRFSTGFHFHSSPGQQKLKGDFQGDLNWLCSLWSLLQYVELNELHIEYALSTESFKKQLKDHTNIYIYI